MYIAAIIPYLSHFITFNGKIDLLLINELVSQICVSYSKITVKLNQALPKILNFTS